jgi:hypothetical protein
MRVSASGKGQKGQSPIKRKEKMKWDVEEGQKEGRNARRIAN